jgi:uncharacterized protein involved in type VI secretion and phage assembly
VIIGFQDNNAERPFVMGAVHTEQNKSGNDHTTNNLKVLGTKTGRRLEIDDEAGYMSLADNYSKKTPKNIVYQKRKDSDTVMKIASHKSDDNFSNIILTNEESLQITVTKGGTAVTEIKLESGGNKITIKSKGTIDLIADGDMSMSAANITMKASGELKMEGNAGVDMKGAKVAIKADGMMEVKGAKTLVEGSAAAEFKGGMMASITAALVKIN